MTSPMLTVLVLAVLWLIVVVPMIVRRHDDRAHERSVEQFGRSMRAPALSMRAPAGRRPVPAAKAAPPKTALPKDVPMYHPDRTAMSPARLQMMARRRRSLAGLGLGSIITFMLAIVLGGALWVPALLFLAGLGGYLYFLRSQVLRDRERHDARRMRESRRGPVSYADADNAAADGDVDNVAEPGLHVADSTVRIDDDLALDDHVDHVDHVDHDDHDTVDLTGLYAEEFAHAAGQRQAS